jgi:hypothetical protein
LVVNSNDSAHKILSVSLTRTSRSQKGFNARVQRFKDAKL